MDSEINTDIQAGLGMRHSCGARIVHTCYGALCRGGK